jgi:arginine repressor
MLKRLSQICTLMALPIALCLAADVVTAVHGTVTKVDNATKTIVVKTKDGTEHTLHFVAKTTVSGADAGAKDTFKGVKEGSEVVAHFTVKGTEKTAVEVDKVGKDGMKETEGTVSDIDRGAKTIAVKTADGTVQTFKMADHATEDAGKDIAKGTEKTAKVTVYYTEEAGKKVAHWFEGK